MQFNPRHLRSKRGKAEEKKILTKDWEMLQSMSWHLTILSIGNEESTYDGMYPQGVGKARDTNRENMKELEEKIKSICL